MWLLWGLPLRPGRGDGCLGSHVEKRLASRSMRTACRCLVLGRATLLMVPLSLRVGFSLCERRPAVGVKQTYPRVGAVLQLAAATTFGHVASGL